MTLIEMTLKLYDIINNKSDFEIDHYDPTEGYICIITDDGCVFNLNIHDDYKISPTI